MAKGDDAVWRKKNKASRKKMRASNKESTVSARVASIIASKRRLKAGKRRMCEGMCFSLPTPDDPFNDRNDPKAKAAALALHSQKKPKKPLPQEAGKRSSPILKVPNPETGLEKAADQKKERSVSVSVSPSKDGLHGGKKWDDNAEGCLSKFLVLCLNEIYGAWQDGDSSVRGMDRSLLAGAWGVKFWRSCSTGSNIVDASVLCASREQVAWLVSTASDIISKKEKEGLIVASPFLLFLVPSQDKAIEVRSICKPLKSIGIHTVSLHPGASLDHQVHGLKSCEPEFLVSTPERLLELLSLGAIDISIVSVLVIDGLESFIASGLLEKIKSIWKFISENPQTVVFGDCRGAASMAAMQILLRGSVCWLSLHESETTNLSNLTLSVDVHQRRK